MTKQLLLLSKLNRVFSSKDSSKNMLLSKNPQFLSDHYEILTKECTHEDLILTKFCIDRVKIVDFLVKTYFLPSPDSTVTHCTISKDLTTTI